MPQPEKELKGHLEGRTDYTELKVDGFVPLPVHRVTQNGKPTRTPCPATMQPNPQAGQLFKVSEIFDIGNGETMQFGSATCTFPTCEFTEGIVLTESTIFFSSEIGPLD